MNKKVTQKYTIKESEIGRADLVSVKKFCFTRNQAQNYLKSGQILVNGEISTSKRLLKKGDKLSLLGEKTKVNGPVSVPIIYEDKDILVIDKPAGISVHPAPGEKDLTVSEIFENKMNFSRDTENLGIVHRLDKGTSGVMVLAKNEKVEASLKNLFKLRKVKKTYLTLVEGRLIPKEGIIDLPLKRDTVKRERIGVSQSGKRAKTKYKVLKYFDKWSYLEVMPETGRTHQIRVHLSSLGYPLLNDKRYGEKKLSTDRIFLHAYKIEFLHPESKKKVSFVSKLPKELTDKLSKLS